MIRYIPAGTNPTKKRPPKSIDAGHVSVHLNKLPLRIEPIKYLHALLIHGKHNATRHDQPRQPGQRAAPKRQQPLLLENDGRAPERVAVLLARLDALHSRLDRVQRLRHVHRDQTRNAAHGEGGRRPQLFPGRRVPLGQLLEERVSAEARRAVGRLPRGGGHEALEEAADAALAVDDGDGVQEAAHAGVGRFAVVDAVEKSVLETRKQRGNEGRERRTESS
jgi:hypothetical protein